MKILTESKVKNKQSPSTPPQIIGVEHKNFALFNFVVKLCPTHVQENFQS